jgi:hypothetical protein
MSEPSKEKRVQAFYTVANAKGTPVSVWINDNDKKGAPDFDGKVGNRRVSIYLRTGKKGPFLSVLGSNKGEDGKLPQLGTANLVINAKGIPKLAIKMEGKEETVWASVSKKIPAELMTKMGFDAEAAAAKRADAAKAAVAKEEPAAKEKKKTPAP